MSIALMRFRRPIVFYRGVVSSRKFSESPSRRLVSWLTDQQGPQLTSDGKMLHVVAFSGGVDSSVVADRVYTAFPESSLAVLAVSPSLPAEQRTLAHQVAKSIGIPLHEVRTNEGEKELYIENEGQACYACKTSLYQSMGWDSVVKWASTSSTSRKRVRLYNGTNADDVKDATRVGLRAAQEYEVSSPLLANGLTKQQVREVAKDVGLPNWNIAASPCLRSRLALGVQATPKSLERVERAEIIVKAKLGEQNKLDEAANIRVRHLKNGSAAIELDDELLSELDADTLGNMTAEIAQLGYASVQVRPFRSGAVST